MAYSKVKRRAYQRDYYAKHKEEAQEYQRLYRLKHPKKSTGKKAKNVYVEPRPKRQISFTPYDIGNLHGEPLKRVLIDICAGRRLLVL